MSNTHVTLFASSSTCLATRSPHSGPKKAKSNSSGAHTKMGKIFNYMLKKESGERKMKNGGAIAEVMGNEGIQRSLPVLDGAPDIDTNALKNRSNSIASRFATKKGNTVPAYSSADKSFTVVQKLEGSNQKWSGEVKDDVMYLKISKDVAHTPAFKNSIKMLMDLGSDVFHCTRMAVKLSRDARDVIPIVKAFMYVGFKASHGPWHGGFPPSADTADHVDPDALIMLLDFTPRKVYCESTDASEMSD